MRQFHSKYHISKILIHGYYYTSFRAGLLKYAFIRPSSAILISRFSIVIILT